MDHSANFIEHLYVPGALLNPAGLKKPHAQISRSLQIGEKDRIQGRWKLLLLKDGLGGEGRRHEGGCACLRGGGEALSGSQFGGVVTHLGPFLKFSTPAAPRGLVLSLSQITSVPSCLLPATFQLNHSLKFGAVAKTPLPCNRIFTGSTAAVTWLITCCCNRPR